MWWVNCSLTFYVALKLSLSLDSSFAKVVWLCSCEAFIFNFGFTKSCLIMQLWSFIFKIWWHVSVSVIDGINMHYHLMSCMSILCFKIFLLKPLFTFLHEMKMVGMNVFQCCFLNNCSRRFHSLLGLWNVFHMFFVWDICKWWNQADIIANTNISSICQKGIKVRVVVFFFLRGKTSLLGLEPVCRITNIWDNHCCIAVFSVIWYDNAISVQISVLSLFSTIFRIFKWLFYQFAKQVYSVYLCLLGVTISWMVSKFLCCSRFDTIVVYILLSLFSKSSIFFRGLFLNGNMFKVRLGLLYGSVIAPLMLPGLQSMLR